MKKLLFLLALAGAMMCGQKAHAQCVLPANASQAQVTTAANTANSGGCASPGTKTVQFSAGTTNWTSGVYLPCQGVTYAGPPMATHAAEGGNPTAIINGASVGTSGNMWNFDSCNGLTIEYLWFQNGAPFYMDDSNNSNVTILSNKATSLPDINTGTQSCCAGPNAFEFGGHVVKPASPGGTYPTEYSGNLDQDVLFQDNWVGSTDSCPNSFATPNGEVNSACTAFQIEAGTARRFHIYNNTFYYVNEGVKPVQINTCAGNGSNHCLITDTSSVTDDLEVEWNNFYHINRITFEDQSQVVNNPVLFRHNYVDESTNKNYYGTLTISLACCSNGFYINFGDVSACQGDPSGLPCPALYADDNVGINTSTNAPPYFYEYWGSGSQSRWNYIGGYFGQMYTYTINFTNGQSPYTAFPSQINYNFLCVPNGWTSQWSGWITPELSSPANAPQQVGNTEQGTGCTTEQSVAPAISPASGSYSGVQTVTLSIPAQPATALVQGTNQSIYYTTDGSTPTVSSSRYTGPFTISPPATVKALSQWGVPPQPTSTPYAGYGYVPSGVVTATYTSGGTPTAAQPVLTPSTESFLGTISVSASSTTSGAVLRCTTDGTTPTVASPIYTGAFSVSATTTIQCLATATGYNPSAVGTGVYTLEPTAATPTFSPGTETFTGSVVVTISTATSGATIHYTTNGTTPTSSSTVYSGPITLTANTTVQALATNAGYGNSGVGSAVYTVSTLPTAATPVFTPGSQIFTGTLAVSVADSTSGATVYCTTNGTTPTVSSPVYSAPFSFTATTNLQCIATASGFSQSALVSGTYTLGSSAGQVLGNGAANVAGGTYVNTFNSVYAVTPPGTWTTNQGTLCFGTGTTVSNGSKTDIVLVQATSPTTEAASALCHATYTQASSTAPGCVNLAVTGCGTLSGAYWVNTETNDTLGPSPFAEWNCGSACNSTVPTQGNGSYFGRYAANSYGSYTGLPTTLLQGGDQATVYLTLNPAITSGYLGNVGSVNTLNVGAPAIQFTAYPTYSNATTGSLPDSYGNTATWSSSNAGILTVGSTGLVSCAAAGSANVQATAQPSAVAFTPWTITCSAPPPPASLQSISLAPTGGVTSIVYGATNQIVATCHYSDGSTTTCNTTDSHGNIAGSWTSTTPKFATVSSSGLVTSVEVGSTSISAVAGGFTSNSVALGVTSQQTLTGVTVGASVNTVNIGGTLQTHAYCAYSGGITTQDCSVTDIYGDAVTSWASSNTNTMAINSSGLVTGQIVGTANATAVVNSTVNATPFAITVERVVPTLTGISLATAAGVTGLFVGSTNQLLATCTYSDGSQTNCNNADAQGNIASNWTSTNTGHATVSTSGLVTGVGPGTTTFTAKAGTFTSPALPLTVLAVPTGVYTITITGPVQFSGTVTF